MGQKLQAFFITIFLSVSLFLIGGGRTVSQAQISLINDTPLEVRFSQGESERNESSLTVGLSDLESILSDGYKLQSTEWRSYSEGANTVNYFVPDGISGTAPGRIRLENSPDQTFFVASVKNDSEYSFGNFIIAFDFIYNFFDAENTHEFVLRYKVNDGDWTRLPSGVIEQSALRSVEDTWSSFSLHLNIDDVFLRPSDTIDFMWVIADGEEISDQIPLALQRMEIFPERMEQNSLNRGDLIITEILPSSNVNGSLFEYVEIFNPSERIVSLKGVELKTESGSKVIQRNIFVEPYDFTIISNTDISSLEGVRNSYFYSGSIIKPDEGRVELVRAGDLIASATFESSESGVSLELNQVSQAYDGYSSMQDFSASQTSYFQDLYGSPGGSGHTIPMFKKTLEQSGVYLLSFPGRPIQQLNRNSSLDFYNLDGDELDISNIESYSSVLVKKSDDNPETIYTEALNRQISDSDIYTQVTTNSFLITDPVLSSGGVSVQQKKQNTSQAFPVTQVWNPQEKKFNLRLTDQVQSDHWSPLMVHNSVTSLLESSENQVLSPTPNRFLEFGVLPDNQESSKLSDVAMIGFMDVPTQYEGVRYDLPKLTFEEPALSNQSNDENSTSQSLYLTSTLSDESFNSFTHLPYEIDNEFELGLGYEMSDDAGGAVLRWKISDEIPDEWVIIMEDSFNGTSIDLREENEYRFRYTSSSGNENQAATESPKLSAINPSDRARFVVKVRPYESYSNVTEEEEVPNSIELRPNYPNPFNPSTNINFYLPEERNVRVGVYNIVGQQVALLLDDIVQQGEHSIVWDAADKPSGIYIVQLETGSRIFTRKITLIK